MQVLFHAPGRVLTYLWHGEALKGMSRAVASPTQPEGGGDKNFRWGQIFIIAFKIWSEKQAQKRAGRSTTFALCFFCVIFQSI